MNAAEKLIFVLNTDNRLPFIIDRFKTLSEAMDFLNKHASAHLAQTKFQIIDGRACNRKCQHVYNYTTEVETTIKLIQA